MPSFIPSSPQAPSQLFHPPKTCKCLTIWLRFRIVDISNRNCHPIASSWHRPNRLDLRSGSVGFDLLDELLWDGLKIRLRPRGRTLWTFWNEEEPCVYYISGHIEVRCASEETTHRLWNLKFTREVRLGTRIQDKFPHQILKDSVDSTFNRGRCFVVVILDLPSTSRNLA